MSHQLSEPDRAAFNCDDQDNETWLDRARLCVEMLMSLSLAGERVVSIADIGCGDQKLRAVLQAKAVDCRYHGYDLIPQSGEVVPFDVQKDLLPHTCDVAVMLGVLEYLRDAQRALEKLAGRSRYLIVSHVVRQDNGPYTEQEIRRLKWCNHLSRQDVESMLGRTGFRPLQSVWAADRRTMLFVAGSQGVGASVGDGPS